MSEVEIQRNEEVAALIQNAASIAASGYAAVREAAIACVEQTIIPMGIKPADLKATLKIIRGVYANDWGDQTHLVSQFNAVATVRHADTQPISFKVERTVEGSKVEQEVHTTGAEAASRLSKNDMDKAAKAVREDSGTANAAGGGRGPDQNRNDTAPATTVFSLVELKTQLAGLFGHSNNPVEVLNTVLAEYNCEVTPIEKRVAAKAKAKAA